MNQIERRTGFRSIRPRVETRSSGRMLVGYSAVFYNASDPGSQYGLWQGCYERIAPGAFDRALRERQDVLCVFNHDSNLLQGRTSSGTCRLSVDSVGLKYECDLAEITNPPNMLQMLERGDVTGSSFAFRATSVTWANEDNYEIRWINDVDLFDVGPVTQPAYASSTSGLRSSDVDTLKRERQLKQVNLRLKQLNQQEGVDRVLARINRK